jgi:hypothetical protein
MDVMCIDGAACAALPALPEGLVISAATMTAIPVRIAASSTCQPFNFRRPVPALALFFRVTGRCLGRARVMRPAWRFRFRGTSTTAQLNADATAHLLLVWLPSFFARVASVLRGRVLGAPCQRCRWGGWAGAARRIRRVDRIRSGGGFWLPGCVLGTATWGEGGGRWAGFVRRARRRR